MALWRRLLWGEGDGVNLTRQDEFSDVKENQRKLEALLSGKRFTQGKSISQLFASSVDGDPQSRFHEEEDAAKKSDLNRPAVLLAIALQTHAFPNVSVLDGGFPALIEQLLSTRGTLEPVVINHDEDKWREFLRSTGRSTGLERREKRNNIKTSASQLSFQRAPSEKELTDIERLEIALKVAERLQHKYMHAQLLEKIKTMNAPTVSTTAATLDSPVVDRTAVSILST